jgi:hypothetical protein
LEQSILYGKTSDRKQARFLLCDYLLAAGNACRYRGHMQTALDYLEKALALARENQYEELYLKGLYVRGFTQFNRWTNWPEQQRDADLAGAIEDFMGAAILADGGRAGAYRAQDRQDSLAALHQIDEAGKLVSASGFENEGRFLRVDQEWYHIDKAEALIVSGMPGLALDELENVYIPSSALRGISVAYFLLKQLRLN